MRASTHSHEHASTADGGRRPMVHSYTLERPSPTRYSLPARRIRFMIGLMDPQSSVLPGDLIARLEQHLDALYPPAEARSTLERLRARLEDFSQRHPGLRTSPARVSLDQSDVIVITYGDQVQEEGKPPLQSLDELLVEQAGEFVTGVHILPFYPYTSDDGFSVVDYHQVDPALGDWSHVEGIARHFRLMADAVINHISASSAWFQGFLSGNPNYQDYFISVDPATDLSMVVRPRALPLLTPFETARGTEHVWTTFSEDQIDLNFANPEVLLAMTDVLLHYVSRGAQLIRMDAIAYLWKEPGTLSIHLPETHQVVQFWRAVFDAVAPGTLIVTETNVPHEENVSYFGDGTNEAQLVYGFSLPPLTLHAFLTGDARHLLEWAMGLSTPSDQTTFFNFLASHDGIGVRPAEGILTTEEITQLRMQVEAHGGFVSYRNNPDGTRSPYELNINYFDALNDPAAGEPLGLQVDRFIAAQAILLSMAGVPGIYVHSLFGSRGWPEGVAETGRYRTINRQKFTRAALEAELIDPSSLRHQVFNRYRRLIEARAAEPAFHPQGGQQVLVADPAIFSLLREARDGTSRVLCLHNVSRDTQSLDIDLAITALPARATLEDLLSDSRHDLGEDGRLRLQVEPYQVLWLRDAATA
jgi:glucosylglycerate phosphorylase